MEPALQGKFYPAEDAPKPRKRSFKPSVPTVRKSITPGTVLIVLTGRFRGKRVIFVKQLKSGLLLVTGELALLQRCKGCRERYCTRVDRGSASPLRPPVLLRSLAQMNGSYFQPQSTMQQKSPNLTYSDILFPTRCMIPLSLSLAGPYEVNGVPLRRINQSYVIATSKKIDISKIALPATVNDDFFKAPKATTKAGKTDFLKLEATAAALPENKKAIQKAVDTSIAAAINAEVKAYLKSTFALAKGDKPHEMTF